jgi:hypothetical protein
MTLARRAPFLPPTTDIARCGGRLRPLGGWRGAIAGAQVGLDALASVGATASRRDGGLRRGAASSGGRGGWRLRGKPRRVSPGWVLGQGAHVIATPGSWPAAGFGIVLVGARGCDALSGVAHPDPRSSGLGNPGTRAGSRDSGVGAGRSPCSVPVPRATRRRSHRGATPLSVPCPASRTLTRPEGVARARDGQLFLGGRAANRRSPDSGGGATRHSAH